MAGTPLSSSVTFATEEAARAALKAGRQTQIEGKLRVLVGGRQISLRVHPTGRRSRSRRPTSPPPSGPTSSSSCRRSSTRASVLTAGFFTSATWMARRPPSFLGSRSTRATRLGRSSSPKTTRFRGWASLPRKPRRSARSLEVIDKPRRPRRLAQVLPQLTAHAVSVEGARFSATCTPRDPLCPGLGSFPAACLESST